jgi:hypothetical protein
MRRGRAEEAVGPLELARLTRASTCPASERTEPDADLPSFVRSESLRLLPQLTVGYGQQIGSRRHLRPSARRRRAWPPEHRSPGEPARPRYPCRWTCHGSGASLRWWLGADTSAIPTIPARQSPQEDVVDVWNLSAGSRHVLRLSSTSLLAGASPGQGSCWRTPSNPSAARVRRCAAVHALHSQTGTGKPAGASATAKYVGELCLARFTISGGGQTRWHGATHY